MSFWSTLKNTFRTWFPAEPRTQRITLKLWRSGGELNMSAILPAELAESIRFLVITEERGETLRYFVPHYDFGTESTGPSPLSQLLSCLKNLSHATAGSQDPRPHDCCGQPVAQNTSSVSSSSASTPGAVPTISSDSHGRRSIWLPVSSSADSQACESKAQSVRRVFGWGDVSWRTSSDGKLWIWERAQSSPTTAAR